MNTKAKNISLIIAMAASVYSFNASANDSKFYSGTMCQTVSGKDAQHFLTTPLGGIKNQTYGANSSKMSRRVTCPIVRDKIGNTNGTASVWVSVYRVNPTNDPLPNNAPLTCTIYTSNNTGLQNIDSRTASHTNTGQRWLNLDLKASSAFGSYSFDCLLPEGSSVLSYYVDEF